MDWTELASVDLPLGMQLGDLLGVVDQLEAQVTAALSSKRVDGVPHVKELDPVVAEAFDDLITARDALRGAEQRRPRATAETAAHGTTVANEHADDAWRAIEKLIDAGRSLTDEVHPGRAEAEALHARMFAVDGIRFINYRPRRQWDTARKLIAILAEPDVVATIEALGGARHLKAVRADHKDFGSAYGFSTPTPLAPETTTNTRAEQLALQAALREYLLKVSSRVSKRKPATGELARFLLQPYVAMSEDLQRSPRAAAPKSPPPPVGAPGAATAAKPA